ncbi:hypothetical protein [Leptospira licerasiae]|uniref:Uncharacterized protein n=1 Tax=Leptospira licerasiae str. MMD4847 TaxID=1049971 RepID=A0ABP2RGN5_9LEPT|nr:hypothetical protein [Leptospira licerasiae]EIE01424.1 hypothetical protein LEP1GSC185_3947 [Leptospira licerasiae serovar Varillal str. VAR 010]EJZ42326.1 hypothetical protein LEP1GSC178_0016 [Leptospira licerasiae str. MMD4847]
MKSLTFQDLARLQLQNQFNILGTEELKDPKKLYFITAIHASGPWTIQGKTLNQDPKFRPFVKNGSGPIQFLFPLCLEEATFSGAIEVTGFFIPSTPMT